MILAPLVAAFGLVPMALSTSASAEVQRPLATVVIGGLVTSTLLTLQMLPSNYRCFASKGHRAGRDPASPTAMPSAGNVRTGNLVRGSGRSLGELQQTLDRSGRGGVGASLDGLSVPAGREALSGSQVELGDVIHRSASPEEPARRGLDQEPAALVLSFDPSVPGTLEVVVAEVAHHDEGLHAPFEKHGLDEDGEIVAVAPAAGERLRGGAPAITKWRIGNISEGPGEEGIPNRSSQGTHEGVVRREPPPRDVRHEVRNFSGADEFLDRTTSGSGRPVDALALPAVNELRDHFACPSRSGNVRPFSGQQPISTT